MLNNILIRHTFIQLPEGSKKLAITHMATVAMNLSYYGFSLSKEATKALSKLSNSQLERWWSEVEPELKAITGDNRNIGDFVVYKNFPKEVLEKSEAEYWIAQICMYWGVPNEYFTQPVEPRPNLKGQPQLKVLHLANAKTAQNLFNSYVQASSRWKDQELNDVLFLADSCKVDFELFGFKENLVKLAKSFINSGKNIEMNTATDVLRLAAGLSDGDISLREKVKFAKFDRKTRRFLLSNLEECQNLNEDIARRGEVFKRLLHALHPGDYKTMFPRVVEAYDELYNDRLETFNAQVENALKAKSTKALKLLGSRPGEFRRRLVHCLDLFGTKAANAFKDKNVLSKLTAAQLISVRRFLETANTRNHRMFPPKGNWAKVQLGEKRAVEEKYVKVLSLAIGQELKGRVPKIKVLDKNMEMVKIPSNDGEVSYARGTEFPIPENMNFIRTASYWKQKASGYGNVWFDNGWNFFDSNWKSMGSCCWDATYQMGGGACFSGDPTNSKEMEGRAAQLIDLNLKELKARGVRYAVWNILCYSRIKFKDAEDVFAALQWGENPQAGKLFEPSRCQLMFPLKGDAFTKYVCYIDLVDNKMVYMDANFKASTTSAAANCNLLQEKMPAFVEYLNSLPSVYDLFKESVDKRNGKSYVVYSDKDVDLKDVQAFVFKPENIKNSFKQFDLAAILSK